MKYVIYAAIVIIALRYGFTYILSDDFQKYGDDHHAQWTCQVNNMTGKLYVLFSKYDKAIVAFTPILKRCPKTSVSEDASFQIAVSLEQLGRRAEAMDAYKKYAETYRGTARAALAARAADFLAGS